MKKGPCVLMLLWCLALPQAWAQPPAPAVEQAKRLKEQVDELRQLGINADAIPMLLMLGQQDAGGGINPLMLLMMARGGGNMEDLLGMTLFSRALASSTGAPGLVSQGNMLLVVENGTVYKVNVETMTLAGSVRYRGGEAAANQLAMLAPLIGMARETAARARQVEQEKTATVAEPEPTMKPTAAPPAPKQEPEKPAP